MKKILIALASIAALSFIASCTKEEANSVEEQGKQITITASIPEGGLTKVGFTTNGDDLKLAWEVGDQITVSIPNVEPLVSQVFTLTGGAGTKSGTFSGTALPAATKYRISYDGGAIYATQTQADTDNTEHLKYAAILNGVSTYSNFTFSQSWATANGGTFTQSSVLRIKAILPGVLDNAVEKVVVKSDANIFAGGNQIVIDLASAPMLGSDNDIIVYASLPGEQVIPAGTKLWVSFQTSDSNAYEKYTAYRELPAMTILAGKVNTIKLNCENIDKFAGKDDDGTAAHPYLIADQNQMAALRGLLTDNQTTHVVIVDDIDMKGVAWIPLNYDNNYVKGIDFDGQDHVITNLTCDADSYPSFFGVLNGTCKNVSFTNAIITSNKNSGCGILGGYAGSGTIHAEASRVHVQGKVTLNGNKTGVGGMFGCLGNANLNACSADVDVYSTKNYVGGLFGYSKKATVNNCWVAGSVYGDQRIGGIAGGINGDGDAIRNSYCVAKLYILNSDNNKVYAASRSVGGIVGHANQDKGNNNETRTPGNVVSGCIAWQEEIKTRTYLGAEVGQDASSNWHDYYSSGAIVAYGATHNTYENCYRRSDLDFRDYVDAFVLYDQENSSPTNPLVISHPVEHNTHNYPYHGKAAAPGKTVSQIAQEIGWSASIWDFSGALPALK